MRPNRQREAELPPTSFQRGGDADAIFSDETAGDFISSAKQEEVI
jgi:hypothetical protein